jgi:hypothetical protein
LDPFVKQQSLIRKHKLKLDAEQKKRETENLSREKQSLPTHLGAAQSLGFANPLFVSPFDDTELTEIDL